MLGRFSAGPQKIDFCAVGSISGAASEILNKTMAQLPLRYGPGYADP